MRQFFTQIFFRSIPAEDVGLFRILFCATVLIGHIIFLPFHLSLYRASVGSDVELFFVSALTNNEFLAGAFLAVLLAVALFCASAGWRPRASLLLATVTFFLFYKPVMDTLTLHHAQLPFFVLLILSVSPGIEALSVQRKSRKQKAYVDSWPVQLPLVLLGLSYFATAFWKIVEGGIAQFNGDVLQYYLAFYGLSAGIELSVFLAGIPPWILAVLGTYVVFFQLTFLLMFVFPRAKPLYVLSGICFHFAILALFHIATFPLFYTSVYFAAFSFAQWRHVYKWSMRLMRVTRDKVRQICAPVLS